MGDTSAGQSTQKSKSVMNIMFVMIGIEDEFFKKYQHH